jgi:hypothetical protein
VTGVEERMRKAAFTLVAIAVLGIVATPAMAAHAPTVRMVSSDTTVLPGQVVTVTVDGPGVERWIGGVNSYFERRRHDGTWQRLYMLVWYGRGEPGVSDPTNLVVDLGVQASPFQAVIPPVTPGTYRITRRFLTNSGYSHDEKTLSTRVTVKACPKGQRPSFTTPPPTGFQYGTPGCAPR